jgi:hypothetical protein
VPTEANRVYLPETKDSAGPGEWKPMLSFTGTGQPYEFTDSEAAGRSRIYRIRILSE